MQQFRILPLLIFLFSISFVQAQEPVKAPGLLFDVSVASSKRLGKKNPDRSLQNYTEKLRTGISYDASLYFRVKTESKHFVGFKYNLFQKEAGINGGYDPSMPNFSTSDKISLGFYGVGYMFVETDSDAKSEWMLESALGYMTYHDKATLGRDKYEITGNSFGLFVGAAYYIKLYKAVHIGPKFSLLVGGVKKLEVEGPTNTNQINPEVAESLTRFDAAASIRFKF